MVTTVTPTPTDPLFGGAGTYLRDYAPEMADRVALTLTPRFDPERDVLSAPVLSLADEPVYRPYPAQAVAVQGIDTAFDFNDVVLLCGEMGTGKTPIGGWVSKVLRIRLTSSAGTPYPIRIAISAPNQLVDKWARHAQALIPDANITIVRDYRAVLPLRSANRSLGGPGAIYAPGRPQLPEVWIFPRDRSKLGYAWAPAACERRQVVIMEENEQPVPGSTPIRCKSSGRRYRTTRVLTCPRCGTVVKVEVTDGRNKMTVNADEEYFEGRTKRRCQGQLPARAKPQTIEERERARQLGDAGDMDTRPCGEPLWRAYGGGRWEDHRDRRFAYGTNGKFGATLRTPGVAPRRIAASELVHRYAKKYFDLYIADEVHELKGDTLQGQMFADFCGASDRVLMMTGTLSGGYAENLRNLLWRTFPGMMIDDGFAHGDADEFTRRYGVLKETKKWIEKPDKPNHILGRGRPDQVRTKNLPGIAPTTFTNFLLPRTVFIRLMEMSDHLPPFKERLNMVPLNDAQAEVLAQMHADFDRHRQAWKDAGLPVRSWSGARSAFLRWPDKPIVSGVVTDFDEFGQAVEAFRYPALPESVEYPKERRLRRRLCLSKRRGLKSWVFTNMTGPGWNVTDRLVTYLSRYGLKCAVLNSEGEGGPNPMDRERWITEHEKRFDVIISNPELVKTGLDLYSFTHIHFYFCGENTYTLRQAARRHWRLGQLNECLVDYYCYNSGMAVRPANAIDEFDDEPPTLLDAAAPKPKVKVRCIQAASMGLMSKKLAASLALEGDFDENGLAAMVGDGEDVASKLARVIAGELVPDARAEFAEYRRKLEASMPNLGAALPIDPPQPEPVPVVTPEIPAILKREPFHSSSPEFRAPATVQAPTVPTPAPVLRIAPSTQADVMLERPAPTPTLAAPTPLSRTPRKVNRTERELLESVIGFAAGANVRNCLHFGKRWAAFFTDSPTKVRADVMKDNLRMLKMLDKDGVLVFCVKAANAGTIGECEAGMVVDTPHVLTAITLADWDRGIRVGRCESLYALRG